MGSGRRGKAAWARYQANRKAKRTVEEKNQKMAAPAVLDESAKDLTDDQIEQLLQLAEERTRNPSSTALTRSANHEPAYSYTKKPAIAGLPTPYIETNGEIAQADARRLVENSTRVMANGIRKVEDPLVSKKKTLDVGDLARSHILQMSRMIIHSLLRTRAG